MEAVNTPRDGAVGIVAGSGIELTEVLDAIEFERPFDPVPGAPPVAGHANRFVLGSCAGRRVIIQCGRRHLYEGLNLRQATSTVDALHEFGVKTLILTNAVGGIGEALRVGDLVAADSVRTWPYLAQSLPEALKPDFISPGCDATGAYRWMHGPCYETRAEIRALRALGDLTVGMSVAPELFRCKELGIAGGVISCVTNACGQPDQLSHESVLAAARKSSQRLARIIRAFIAG